MKFDLIDQVLELSEDTIVATKCVTTGEEYLQDHFPGFPVLPGVMMLETMAQAARRLVESQPDCPQWPLIIKDVRNIRYGNMIRPGQMLKVTVCLRKREDDGVYAFEGTGEVGDTVAVQGRFTLMTSNQLESAAALP